MNLYFDSSLTHPLSHPSLPPQKASPTYPHACTCIPGKPTINYPVHLNVELCEAHDFILRVQEKAVLKQKIKDQEYERKLRRISSNPAKYIPKYGNLLSPLSNIKAKIASQTSEIGGLQIGGKKGGQFDPGPGVGGKIVHIGGKKVRIGGNFSEAPKERRKSEWGLRKELHAAESALADLSPTEVPDDNTKQRFYDKDEQDFDMEASESESSEW